MEEKGEESRLHEEGASQTVEEVVESSLGESWRWQLKALVPICLLLMTVSWALTSIGFIGSPVPFHCVDEASNVTCSTHDGRPCTAWVYDRSVFEETIGTTWDLVCEKKQGVYIIQSVFLFGVMVGGLLSGKLSDRLGRKLPLACFGVVHGISGILSGLSPWLWGFALFRFLEAVGVAGLLTLSLVLAIEMSVGSNRVKMSALINVFLQISYSIGGGVGYLARNWRVFQIVTTAPALLSILCYWLVPESPRWLIAAGKNKEALEVLRTAAKINGGLIPEKLPHSNSPIKNAKRGRLSDLVRTPNLRIRTLALWTMFASQGLCVYGMDQYVGHNLSSGIYATVGFAGLFGTAGVMVAMVIMHTKGRKASLLLGLFVTSVFAIVLAILPNDPSLRWARSLCAAFTLAGSGIFFPTINLYASEIFPTVIRNTALGTTNFFIRFGAMISPYIVSLSHTGAYLPPLVFGCTSVIGLFFVFLLPETLNSQLPVTVEEAENFTGTNRKKRERA